MLKRGNIGHIKNGLGLKIVGRHTYCDERPVPTLRWNLAILKTVLEIEANPDIR